MCLHVFTCVYCLLNVANPCLQNQALAGALQYQTTTHWTSLRLGSVFRAAHSLSTRQESTGWICTPCCSLLLVAMVFIQGQHAPVHQEESDAELLEMDLFARLKVLSITWYVLTTAMNQFDWYFCCCSAHGFGHMVSNYCLSLIVLYFHQYQQYRTRRWGKFQN